MTYQDDFTLPTELLELMDVLWLTLVLPKVDKQS
jgi:hypothetical protein